MDRDVFDRRVNFDCDKNPKSLTIADMEVQYRFLPSRGKDRATKYQQFRVRVRAQMSTEVNKLLRVFALAVLTFVFASLAWAANVNTRSLTAKSKSQKVTESQRAPRHMSHLAKSRVTPASRRTGVRRRHRYYERFYTSSYAEDITEGDITPGEDAVVRQAAIDALGNMNGTVVAIEPTSGRVLAMVNQK